MKYISPSYELEKIESQDIITASFIDNGKVKYEANGNEYEGNKGTFSGWFDEIY